MLKPKGNRCLVERIKIDGVTKTGFEVLEDGQTAPASIRALVIAVGPDVRDTSAGDLVLISQFAPTEAKEKPFDKTLLVFEEDIMATIVPDKVS